MPNHGGYMSQPRTIRLGPGGSRGFTIIELAVTLAVVGVIAAIAVPSLQALINVNRLAGTAGELTAALQVARSEAVRRNARVTVCAGSAGVCSGSTTWTNWTVFGSDNAAGSDDVIRDDSAPSSVQLTGSADRIVFRPSGQVTLETALNVCIPTSNPTQNKRIVTVMASGGVRTAPGTGGTCP